MAAKIDAFINCYDVIVTSRFQTSRFGSSSTRHAPFVRRLARVPGWKQTETEPQIDPLVRRQISSGDRQENVVATSLLAIGCKRTKRSVNDSETLRIPSHGSHAAPCPAIIIRETVTWRGP